MTVAGGDVTGRNLGLVYDLLAPCECGYGNGMPLQTAISIDGNMVDWASVLSDLDNSACDAADSTDRDYKVQSTGRNLVRISFTYNATNFYMFTQRTGQNNNTQTFVYYCDADNDGLVEAGEPAIAALWQGNNGTVDMRMYAYQPDDPAGDPLVDGDGYADGYAMPGTLSYVRDLGDGQLGRSRGNTRIRDGLAHIEYKRHARCQQSTESDRRQPRRLRRSVRRLEPVRRRRTIPGCRRSGCGHVPLPPDRKHR